MSKGSVAQKNAAMAKYMEEKVFAVLPRTALSAIILLHLIIFTIILSVVKDNGLWKQPKGWEYQ